MDVVAVFIPPVDDGRGSAGLVALIVLGVFVVAPVVIGLLLRWHDRR
jgi:hypothetical protein